MLAITLGKIDQLKAQLDSVAPFNEGEQKRLREQFMIEYTYNSNAIEGSTLTLHETALVLLEDLTIAEKPSSTKPCTPCKRACNKARNNGYPRRILKSDCNRVGTSPHVNKADCRCT